MPAEDESRRVLSVSQLNDASRQLLESRFASVWVEGEISNFQAATSGHWYFTLKDQGAQIRCAMFRGRNIRARLKPSHGDAVLVRGAVSLYAARGDYQLIVEELEAAGLGALQRALEALRRRLQTEGLFDPARKRSLPRFPAHVGIVSSLAGAALHDMLTVLRRRHPALRVSVFPTAVQGADAARQIAEAIATANRLATTLDPPLELLLVGRGGGSLEDLWAFNEEPVLRAIHASALPVVSAVGHETDVTLSDLVADVRAPTPSAAAELVSPDRQQLVSLFGAQRLRLQQLLLRRLAQSQERVQWLSRRLRHPGTRLREQAQRLDELEMRLRAVERRRLEEAASRLAAVQSRLLARNPVRSLADRARLLAQLQRRLLTGVTRGIAVREQRLGSCVRLLDSVSPLATLGRGYAIVSDTAGGVLRDAGAVATGTRVRARLARGHLDCEVVGSDPGP